MLFTSLVVACAMIGKFKVPCQLFHIFQVQLDVRFSMNVFLCWLELFPYVFTFLTCSFFLALSPLNIHLLSHSGLIAELLQCLSGHYTYNKLLQLSYITNSAYCWLISRSGILGTSAHSSIPIALNSQLKALAYNYALVYTQCCKEIQ